MHGYNLQANEVLVKMLNITFSETDFFRCDNRTTSISLIKVCDNFYDCMDGMDERLCPAVNTGTVDAWSFVWCLLGFLNKN